MSSAAGEPGQISDDEREQVERANSSGRTPVVFVHGLWLLPNSWDRWTTVFEEAGYSAVTAGWPDDPQTVEEAKAKPEVFAGKSVGDIADYVAGLVEQLDTKPVVVGPSFGGLMTQIVAGRGFGGGPGGVNPPPLPGGPPPAASAPEASA